jgi:hypothetical protein
MDISEEWTKKDYPKGFKIGYLLEERKEGDKKQDGKKAYSENGRMWSTRWRLGGQTSLEIGCRKTLPYAMELLHTYIIIFLHDDFVLLLKLKFQNFLQSISVTLIKAFPGFVERSVHHSIHNIRQ